MIHNKHLLFVDVETSGFGEQGGYIGQDLLTWSGIVTDLDFNIIDKKTIKSKAIAPKLWSKEAEEVHGISLKEAETFQHPKLACKEILNFLKPFEQKNNWPLVWVEHSINWIDFNFTMGLFLKTESLFDLRKTVCASNRISSIKIARDEGYRSNKLNEWADRLNIELKHHDSESDTKALYEVMKFLCKNNINKEKLNHYINVSKLKRNQVKI